MTLEELKAEAKKMGYRLVKSDMPEKLLPCICGHTVRTHAYRRVIVNNKPKLLYVLECKKCGFMITTSSQKEKDQNKAWNNAIKKKMEETNGV